MGCTHASKRLSPSSPLTPPHRESHKRKQETEEDEETEADADNFIKKMYPRRHGKDVYQDSADDIPPETSEGARRRLLLLQDPSRIDEHLLSRLSSLLLDDDDDHESIPKMPNLSQVVAGMFETERWRDLADHVLEAIYTNSGIRQEMALRVLVSLPETREESHGAYKFWGTSYESLFLRFLDLFDSLDLNIQALTYDASVKLIPLLHLWSFNNEIDILLPKMIVWLLQAFDDKEDHMDIVETRMMDLVGLAESCTSHFVKRIDFVLTCMFRIVATADDKTSTFLMSKAIRIIRILNGVAVHEASMFYAKLSDENKSRIMENCLRLMSGIEDVPTWYDTDRELNELIGVSENILLGKLLLFRICVHSHQDLLLTFGFDVIPRYLNSQDWQIRQAAVFAFGAIGLACSHIQAVIREQAERVLDISLSDSHPRVLWAAIDAILSLTANSAHKEHVGYLNKFLPRVITIFKSTSIYPRLQFHAASVVRRLIKNCDQEDVKSFLEDLVPGLLKFLKQNEKCWEQAMEILVLLAAFFPVSLRRYYRETVDSLKPFVSLTLFGARSIECLSHIFSAFLDDHSLPLLSDAQEVFMSVFQILNNWTSTDQRVKAYILQALFQLCKLQIEADKFLDKIVPVLILILEETDNPITKLTIDKQSPSSCEQKHMACELLSNFAVQFQEQFAPWASRVSPLLTSMAKKTTGINDYAKIASTKALPKVLLSCQNRKDSERLFNSTVKALVEASLNEFERANGIVMLKSLNECIAISRSIYSEDVLDQIVALLEKLLSQESLFTGVEEGEFPPAEIDKLEQEEEIIQAAKCLETMISTFKSAFLHRLDELLPLVEGLWGGYNDYPERVKESAISTFNLLLKDYPDTLQRYSDTYAQVVMELCYSESPHLQREAARGIGLCATRRELISNFDANVAIDMLYDLIERDIELERRMAYDAAASALGKICEFWRHTINGPKVVPMWLYFLPLRNDFKEAKYAHRQFCQMLERDDQDLLGVNNENLDKISLVLKEILLQGENLATEETTNSIISLLNKFGGMS